MKYWVGGEYDTEGMLKPGKDGENTESYPLTELLLLKNKDL